MHLLLILSKYFPFVKIAMSFSIITKTISAMDGHLLKFTLTHLFPMHPFPIPWKNQKTVKFSDVFRE